MGLTFSVEKTHLAFFLVAVVVVVGVAYVTAAVPDPGHSYSQIELPTGVWTGLNADKVDGLDGSQLCKADGTDCQGAPAGGPVSTGLYGWCVEEQDWDSGSWERTGETPLPPATFSTRYRCGCGAGYTKVITGTAKDGYRYYCACYKN